MVTAAAFVCLASLGAGEEIGEPDFEVSESYEALEKLEELRDEPLDLNRASVSELLAIPWITPLLAEGILAWRQKAKGFASLDDLRSLPRVTDELFDKISPYLKVGEARPREKPYPLRLLLRSRLADRRPREEGYVGDSRKVYNRLKVDIGEDLSLGLLAEKDAYERSYGDFLCGYFHVQGLGFVDQVVLGNYELDFGEGLLFSPPRFTMKTSGIIKRPGKGLEPYGSSDENSSLLGCAFSTTLGGFEFVPFYSRSTLDATLDENGEVESLYESGYHRTQTELDKVDRVTEELFGGRVDFGRSDWLKAGFTGYWSRYDPAFCPEEETYYTFSGDRFSLVSADFDLLAGGLELFGEYAKSAGLGEGTVLGSIVSLPPAEISTVFRKFDDDFYSPHSAAFADGKDQNELGAFGAIGYRLSKRTKLKAYFDLFEHPKPAYRAPFPISGEEAFGEIEHRLIKDLTLHIRYRSKGKDESTKVEDGSKLLLHRRENFRFQADWEESKSLSLRLRTELSKAEIPDLASEERGGMLLLAVVSRPVEGLRLEGRVIYFDTDSYDSRIYEYENDLPGVMTNQALYGKGRRFYLLVKERLTDLSKVSMKWGITSKEEETTRTEYGLQLDLRL